MKAIRIHQHGGPEVLRYEDVADAPAPPGQVRVRVAAAGVNFIDTYQRSGLYTLPLPAILGQEGAGTIEEAGPGVTEFARGERVVWAGPQGAYAEIATVPADRAVRVPDGVDDRLAAALMLQGITAHYLATSTFPLHAGHVCLVHAAAGGVGLLLCQIAKRRGARVIGTCSTPDKAKLARGAGADHVILYGQEDFESEARRLTDGVGVDVVYDSVGRATFEKSLGSLARRGTLVLFGASSGPVPPFDPQVLSSRGSLYLTRPNLGNYTATREELLDRAGEVLKWVEDGSLSVRVWAELPLERAADAHRDLEGRRTTGKVLLIP
ncbi:MAG: quinone oxidoreductase [Candidatus Eisenbacteria bacterium]|uniref:Quinone oxidoreductase n=1 Tax=Eiseniibacteriota bacterium TaxID=2212470 RepID=A0A538TVS4_UNCEI|nr:MAG: quinone oxidoreductase [Candidatus Eisenbacteria bacterium]